MMIEWLIYIDKQLFLALNELNAPWLDPIMVFISGKLEWVPLYGFLLYLLIKQYRWQSLYFLIGIAITILLSDQLTSGFMKPFFARPRPSHDLEISQLVHIVNDYRGGKYGFASSHAANTFAVATYFFLLLRKHFPAIIWIFAWCTLVSYSRIYLGVHYPGDIIVGAMIGTSFAALVYAGLEKLRVVRRML